MKCPFPFWTIETILIKTKDRLPNMINPVIWFDTNLGVLKLKSTVAMLEKKGPMLVTVPISELHTVDVIVRLLCDSIVQHLSKCFLCPKVTGPACKSCVCARAGIK